MFAPRSLEDEVSIFASAAVSGNKVVVAEAGTDESVRAEVSWLLGSAVVDPPEAFDEAASLLAFEAPRPRGFCEKDELNSKQCFPKNKLTHPIIYLLRRNNNLLRSNLENIF